MRASDPEVVDAVWAAVEGLLPGRARSHPSGCLGIPPLAGHLDWEVTMNVMEKDRSPGRARRRFTTEFKADAVALVLDGDRPVAHVACDLGIGETSLGSGVR